MSSSPPRIRVLPETVASRIAAGEVVERPASVLKELLENALDAGAGRIEVEAHGAGKRSLRVVDDGCGLVPEDCRAALGRHATSKLGAIEDLEELSTLGFRGEALYAISAVSEGSLASTVPGSGKGWRIEWSGGTPTRECESAPVPGTAVEVRDLFFNTPARLKFLKTDPAEKARLTRVIEEVALARPGLRLSYRLEGRLVLRLGPASGEGALETRVGEVLGISFLEALLPVEAQRIEEGGLGLSGLVSRPDRLAPTRGSQYLFVNGRPVGSRTVQQAVYKAYEDRHGKHPAFVLFLECPAGSVDVNVHPRKSEVRFKEEGRLFEFVARTLGRSTSRARAARPLAPAARGTWAGPGGPGTWGAGGADPAAGGAEPAFPAPLEPLIRMPAPASGTSLVQEELAPSRRSGDPAWWTPPFRYLGSLEESYLVFEAAGGLLLVDQHAAAERVRFERFMGELASGRPCAQRLMLPIEVELPASRFQALLGLKAFLADSGLETEPFGERTLHVLTLPESFPLPQESVRELLERLAEAAQEAGPAPTRARPETLREALASLACRGAVKAHERLSEKEAVELLEDLRSCQAPVCPHGRPALLAMDRGEIARRFKRPGPPPL